MNEITAHSSSDSALPDKRPGMLRPLVGTNLADRYDSGLSSNVALRLLLYVPEVALDRDPISRLFALAENRVTDHSRRTMRLILGQLAYLRPFVYQGIVHFTPVHDPANHPQHAFWEVEALDIPGVRDFARQFAFDHIALANERGDDFYLRPNRLAKYFTRPRRVRVLGPFDLDLHLSLTLRSYFTALKMGLVRMEEGTANPLSRTEAQQQLLSALLSGRKIGDNRYSLMSTLARFPVPDFSDNPKLLVQLRKNDDNFNALRQKLEGALPHITEMPDSANLAEASAIVREELLSALTDVERSTKKSAVLQAANRGVVQFGVAAVGAVSAGVVTGSPVAGLLGALSTALGNTVVQTLQAWRTRRPDRLVLELAASFDTKKVAPSVDEPSAAAACQPRGHAR